MKTNLAFEQITETNNNKGMPTTKWTPNVKYRGSFRTHFYVIFTRCLWRSAHTQFLHCLGRTTYHQDTPILKKR